MGQKEWGRKMRAILKRFVPIIFSSALLVVFFEISSTLLLNNVVDPTRMKRFDDLFLTEPMQRTILPHPFLGWVGQQYLREQERYLNMLGKGRNGTILIVAMGGSTTAEGWPYYTEEYLNDRLEEINATLRAEVFNFGVSGWSSINSIQNYAFITRFLHPEFIIYHHNINDANIDFAYCMQQSVLQYPSTGAWEKALLVGSRFYKVLKLLYHLGSYNLQRYGNDAFGEMKPDLPMQSRVSFYLNEKDSSSWPPTYFSLQSMEMGALPRVSWEFGEFLLNDSYEWLIRVARTDNTTVVLTTMYLNYSEYPGEIDAAGKSMAKQRSDAINDLIRQAGGRYNVTVVDLAMEMESYDFLLKGDGVHWSDEGVRLKGQIIGEEVFQVIKERYGIGGAQEGGR